MFGKTTGMFLVGAEAGEWVVGLLPGCVASFPADEPERISRGRRDGTSQGRPGGLFSCPNGPFIKCLFFLLQMASAIAQFFPTSGVHSSRRGEEECCPLQVG